VAPDSACLSVERWTDVIGLMHHQMRCIAACQSAAPGGRLKGCFTVHSNHSPRRRLTLGVSSAVAAAVALALVMTVLAAPVQAAQADSRSVAAAPAPAPLTPEESAELSGFDPLRAAQCVGAVGAFVAGNALVVVKIRRAGGVVKVAKSLLEAGSAEKRLKVALTFFGDITGVTGVVEACG
jgi:hypothetical protein